MSLWIRSTRYDNECRGIDINSDRFQVKSEYEDKGRPDEMGKENILIWHSCREVHRRQIIQECQRMVQEV